MSEEMIDAPKKKSLKDFMRKRNDGQAGSGSKAGVSLPQFISLVFPDGDRVAAALASGIALSRLISRLEMDSADRADAWENIEIVLDFLLGEAKKIPDATLGIHGVKKDPQGSIVWGEGK